MKRINLLWYGPYSVVGLSEVLRQSVRVSDEKYPLLNNYGFYMYLDKNLSKVIYIGQAFDRTRRSLRNRIRWEITKDGKGCALSKFSADCQKNRIDTLSLMLKVAHIKEATDNGNQIIPDPKLMNDIEKALIHDMAWQHLINKSGKKRYRRGSIEISNSGNFAPLHKMIKR